MNNKVRIPEDWETNKVRRPKEWPAMSQRQSGVGTVLDSKITTYSLHGGCTSEMMEVLVLWENGAEGWEVIGHGVEWLFIDDIDPTFHKSLSHIFKLDSDPCEPEHTGDK